MKNRVAGTFRSLRSFNFRLWTAGGLVSNVGTWMQRVAQDWLVLTQLTHHDASALGIVMGLQFAPQLLLLPWTGSAADRLNQRKLLMLTQNVNGSRLRPGATASRTSTARRLAMRSSSASPCVPPSSNRTTYHASKPRDDAARFLARQPGDSAAIPAAAGAPAPGAGPGRP